MRCWCFLFILPLLAGCRSERAVVATRASEPPPLLGYQPAELPRPDSEAVIILKRASNNCPAPMPVAGGTAPKATARPTGNREALVSKHRLRVARLVAAVKLLRRLRQPAAASPNDDKKHSVWYAILGLLAMLAFVAGMVAVIFLAIHLFPAFYGSFLSVALGVAIISAGLFIVFILALFILYLITNSLSDRPVPL